jgi:hypothetical protein
MRTDQLSDEEGICDCQRYCGGGKVVNGATFRRHNLGSDNDATQTPSSDRNKRRKRTEATVKGEETVNALVDKLASMPAPSVTELREWFERENIWIHQSLEITTMADSSGLGIFAVDVGVPQQVGRWSRYIDMPLKEPNEFSVIANSLQDPSFRYPLQSHYPFCRQPVPKYEIPNTSNRATEPLTVIRISFGT